MAEIQVQPTEEQLVRNWERFFQKYYKPKINEAALAYPEKRSVEVDFWDIDRHDPQLGEFLLQNPNVAIFTAEQGLRAIDVPLDEKPALHFRPRNLPPSTAKVDVRNLRARHLGKLVAIEGLVKRASDVRPKIQDAAFKCLRCGAIIKEPQDEHMVFKEPLECYEDQGGCARQSNFKLLTERSRFVDSQVLDIQEAPETMRGGEQPQRLKVHVEDDLCGQLWPGDRVLVNGILRSSVQKKSGVKLTVLEIHLEVVSVEPQQKEFQEIDVTPEDEAEIIRFSKDPEIYYKMVRSLAPEIYGMETEKLALVLQLFGGVEKRTESGTHLRGDIHILMVGDPGVAKSQLLRYVTRLAPRAIYTSGKSSTAAGLTASAVRDETDGRWNLEAGALVLADRGVAAIDEMDKMDENDRSAMHEAMEQQTISIAKAGITATLNSRCSVLGAANPKDGRFEEYASIPEQIDMPPALLSRFDVIFPLTDKPEVRRDDALASHILGVHRAGGIRRYREQNEEGLYTAEQQREASVHIEPDIPRPFLRKYVAHSKRTCFPVLGETAMARIREHYVGLRRQALAQGGPIPMTPRQLEAIVRLAEASARLRYSNEATVEDVDRAIGIVDYYLKRVAGDERGIDAGMLATGVSQSQRDRIHAILEIVRELAAGESEGAAVEDIVAKAQERASIPPEKTRETLQKLNEQGRLYKPREGRFKPLH
ncbi:MAG TPA: minichromosome maintenance protein MCM [Candidatus Thermoplasmatota archaeon]|nr:minichromosome maintenance protein MCM [Candidatus Thermoplasmatota archaeon]